MLVLGPIAFTFPWSLGALLVLPAAWWLLRVTPPVPQLVRFPAVRLLRELVAREETPAHTPLWLVVLRLLVLGLLIVGFSGPVLHPTAMMPGRGPVVLVVDDGWASARNWPLRQRWMADLVIQAERQGRELVIVATAPSATGIGILGGGPVSAPEAGRLIQGLEPRPWPVDRAAAAAALRGVRLAGAAHAVWLSDGVDDSGAGALIEVLRRLGGGVEVVTEAPTALPDLVLPPETRGGALVARLVRAVPGAIRPVDVRLSAGDGRLLAVERATFPAGAAGTEVRFALPLELRNQAVRLGLEGQATVGATVLLDERWRRRPVGLVVNPGADGAQPLLDDLYYLERALAPFSELRRGALAELIGGREGGRDLAVLFLADGPVPGADDLAALGAWVERGGLLVRFAGPRLAHAPDALLPVRLRQGDRVLGGALSWDRPAHLAPFDAGTPFAGLTPSSDITVGRQVLAEPTLDTTERTWARLVDGTPLVTAIRRAQGSIVLVHTTASPEWSNLALSGLFVDMLRRLVALSDGVVGEGRGGALAPFKILDGLGRLGEPPATALPISAAGFEQIAIGPQHPPGFYGGVIGSEERRRALNLTARVTGLAPLRALPAALHRTDSLEADETDLKPMALAVALGLLLADMLIGLGLRGLLAVPRRLGGLLLALALAGGGGAAGGEAAAAVLERGTGSVDGSGVVSEAAERASARTWLAYVMTGDVGVDRVTRGGLEGLARALNRRTAVDTGGDRQREMAVRFGINAVVYALTGNYKADQVHVPAILQRIGR